MACKLGCPGAVCTYKHPNVYKCTRHILILVDKLRFQQKSNKKPDLLPKFPVRTMKMLGGEHSAPHPAASRRVGNLNCCLVHKSANDSQHLYPIWSSREAALSSTGKKPNVQATSWGRGYSENFISIIYSFIKIYLLQADADALKSFSHIGIFSHWYQPEVLIYVDPDQQAPVFTHPAGKIMAH